MLLNGTLSSNGQNGINYGGGGCGGNILINANNLTLLQYAKIECIGGKGHNDNNDKNNNDGENGRIRLYCNKIDGDKSPNQCCNPKPFVL